MARNFFRGISKLSSNFEKYSVQGDERPDQVAYDFYGDSALDWVVLTTYNIVHVRDEWPMGQQDF